jgi:hypothetical protein
MFIAFEFMSCSPHNNRYVLLLENISLYFVLQQAFILRFFLVSFILCLISYLHFLTCLYSITMFTQRLYTIKQQLALCRLMHSIHCGSAIFPYQALEGRPAQETVIGCIARHNIKKFEDIGHSLCIASAFCLVCKYYVHDVFK